MIGPLLAATASASTGSVILMAGPMFELVYGRKARASGIRMNATAK